MGNELSLKMLSQDFDVIKSSLIGGKPSYIKSEVDAFLQEASDLAENLENELSDVRTQLTTLESQSSYVAGDTNEEELIQREKQCAEKSREVEKMQRSFHRMIIMAEGQADEIREQANKDATVVREKAKQEANSILDESKKRAEQLIQEARNRHNEVHQQADEMINSAEEKVNALEERKEQLTSDLGKWHRVIGKTLQIEENMGGKAFANSGAPEEENLKVSGNK